MGQGGSLTEATTTIQIIWGLLNTPEDIKGNVRKFEKIKNLKLNSQTTKKGETREEATSANEARGKQSFERKDKTGLASSFSLSLVGSADINSEINERNKTRSARKRFLKRGLLGKDF